MEINLSTKYFQGQDEQLDEQYENSGCFECNRIVDEGQNIIFQTTQEIQDIKQKLQYQSSDGDSPQITGLETVAELQNPQNLGSQPLRIAKKVKKSFPSETKNIGKNFAQAFKAFLIKTLQPKDKTQYCIRKFLRCSPNELGLQNFRNQIKSSKHLTQLAELYFGQFGWARTFMQNNKTELGPYYRYHSIWLSQDE